MKSPNNKLLINGLEYGQSNCTVLINNTLLTSITNIEYSEETVNENLYGLGNQPVAIGIGNYTYTGSITIRKSELLSLQASARALGDKDGSIGSILPFSVIVSYSRPDNTGTAVDVLNSVQFMSLSNAVAQGDTSINITIPLRIGSISWNKQ
jgi:hypothetical protein